MRMLKMCGYPITNIYDYKKYFNIYDVLKHNKEFLSFASAHFSRLSKSNLYCTAMVYTAVNNRIPEYMCEDIYADLNDIGFDDCDAKEFWHNPFAFCQTCSPDSELLSVSEEIAKQFESYSNDMIYKKIMIISIAAYAFRGNKQIETKIEIERAKMSFIGKEDNERDNPFVIHFEDSKYDDVQTILLDPSSQVYTCLPYVEDDFKRITTYRIIASRKIHSLSNRNVKISVGDKLLIIPAGEHIYVNTVNGRIAKILDKKQAKNNHQLENIGIEKDTLKFEGDKEHTIDFYGNEYITSFDFYTSDKSIIYINNMKLCLDKCSSTAFLDQLSGFCDFNLVEVKIVNGWFYLLKNDGQLLSNDTEYNGQKGVYSIEKVLRRVQ